MLHTAYFIGKIVQVLVCMIAEIAPADGRRRYLLSLLQLPSSPGRWWTFTWVCVLGCAACSLLGIAISSLPRSARGASPMITLPFLVLEFISGVFIPFSSVPPWLQRVAAIFLLKWMAQGLRSAFLLLPACRWCSRPQRILLEHGRIAPVLVA